MQWDDTAADGAGAFVVTLYDGDKEVTVEVQSQYDQGLQGESSLLDIYERAYGIQRRCFCAPGAPGGAGGSSP